MSDEQGGDRPWGSWDGGDSAARGDADARSGSPADPSSGHPSGYPSGYGQVSPGEPAPSEQPRTGGFGTTPAAAPYGVPAADVVSSEPGRSRRGAGTVAATALVVVALILAGAGVKRLVSAAGAAAAPAALAPASTFAYAQVHLDPSPEQKVALLDLLAKIPGSPTDRGTKADDLRDTLLRSLFKGTPVDYDADIGSWLGDWAAAAGFTDAAGKPQAVALVRVTSRDDAERTLHRVAATGAIAYDFADGYAEIARNQTALDAAHAATDKGSLADSDTFRTDIATLPGDELLLSWADAPKVAAAARSALGCAGAGADIPLADSLLSQLFGGGFHGHVSCPADARAAHPAVGPTFAGRLVGGVRVEGGYLEGQLRMRGGPAPTGTVTDVSGMLSALPADSSVALGVGAPGALLRKQATLLRALPGAALLGAGSFGGAFSATPGGEVAPRGHPSGDRPLGRDPLAHVDRALSGALGLRFPADVATLLGDRAVLAVRGSGDRPDVGLRTHPTDPDRARMLADRVAGKLADASPARPVVRLAGADLVLASDAAFADRMAARGTLGAVDRYRTAMGDTAGALFGCYVDVRALGLSDGNGDVPVTALGLVVTRDGSDSVYRLRVATD